jgi:hypothetical protein
LADNHVASKDLQRVVQRLPVGLVLGLLDAVLPFLDQAKATKFLDHWTTIGAEMDRTQAGAEEDGSVETESVADEEGEDDAEDEAPSKPESLEVALRELQAQSEVLKAYLSPPPAQGGATKPARLTRQPAEPAGPSSPPSTIGCNGAMNGEQL